MSTPEKLAQLASLIDQITTVVKTAESTEARGAMVIALVLYYIEDGRSLDELLDDIEHMHNAADQIAGLFHEQH